jgi:hypothetical protein
MRCRNLLLAASVLGAIGGSTAFAADLPTKAYSSPVNPVPVMTWFYAGVNAGYGWANVGGPAGGAGSSNNLNGFVGCGQLGSRLLAELGHSGNQNRPLGCALTTGRPYRRIS